MEAGMTNFCAEVSQLGSFIKRHLSNRTCYGLLLEGPLIMHSIDICPDLAGWSLESLCDEWSRLILIRLAWGYRFHSMILQISPCVTKVFPFGFFAKIAFSFLRNFSQVPAQESIDIIRNPKRLKKCGRISNSSKKSVWNNLDQSQFALC